MPLFNRFATSLERFITFDQLIEYSGIDICPPEDYCLNAGYNLISYPCLEPANIVEAISDDGSCLYVGDEGYPCDCDDSIIPLMFYPDVDDGGFPDSKANAMAFKMKAAAAFAAAGLRSEARRTGTSLAREGTGMHATLSRIRSDKGRVKHKKFLQSMDA